MNADRRVNLRVSVSQFNDFPARVEVDPRVEDPLDARLTGAFDNLLAIRIKTIKVQVTVCIDEHIFQTRDPQPIVEDIRYALLHGGLRINPDDRLGTREADQQPAAFSKVILETIRGIYPGDGESANCLWASLKNMLLAGI